MRILTICWLMVFFASLACAETPADRQRVRGMVKELKGLHKAGIAMHSKYDLKDINELKACVAANSHLRDQGKKLMTQARDTTIPMAYRFNLILAADYAFQCVYCDKKTLKPCSEMLPELAELEKKLK